METYCPGVGTGGYTSCRYGDRAVINLARWATAVPDYQGDVATYRLYVVNHEVGHVLGQRARAVPRRRASWRRSCSSRPSASKAAPRTPGPTPEVAASRSTTAARSRARPALSPSAVPSGGLRPPLVNRTFAGRFSWPRREDPPGPHTRPGGKSRAWHAVMRVNGGPARAAVGSNEEQLVSLPPLVEPAADLSIDEVRRYSRHLIIPDVGMDGQKRLKNAKVLAVGAGGLGSPALMYLAAAGVGTLGIVEFDTVDESNLQRQIIHGQSDVGRSKAESARDSIKEINPLIDVRLHETRLDSENVLEIFADYDLIVDGTDNFATRYLVNDACVLLNKPYVWGSIYRFDGQVSVFWNEHGPNYRDLYPVPPPPGMVPVAAPRAACSACSARPSARSRPPRRSSSSPASATRCSAG